MYARAASQGARIRDIWTLERSVEVGELSRLLKRKRWEFEYDWVQAAEALQRTVYRFPKGKQWGADGLTHDMIMPLMVEGEHCHDEAVTRLQTEPSAPGDRYILWFDGRNEPPKVGSAAVRFVWRSAAWVPVDNIRMRLPDRRTVMAAE